MEVGQQLISVYTWIRKNNRETLWSLDTTVSSEGSVSRAGSESMITMTKSHYSS